MRIAATTGLPRSLSRRPTMRAPAPGAPARHRGHSPQQVLALQRAAGNRATTRVLTRQAVPAGAKGAGGGYRSPTVSIRLADSKEALSFEALSFSLDRMRGLPSSRGGARGRPADDDHEVTITKRQDKGSARLMNAAARGTNATKVTIDAGVVVYTLEDALITAFQVNSGWSEAGPTETISLSARKLTFQWVQTEAE